MEGLFGAFLSLNILREYFMERVRFHHEQSITLPRASDPRYIEMAEANKK